MSVLFGRIVCYSRDGILARLPSFFFGSFMDYLTDVANHCSHPLINGLKFLAPLHPSAPLCTVLIFACGVWVASLVQ